MRLSENEEGRRKNRAQQAGCHFAHRPSLWLSCPHDFAILDFVRRSCRTRFFTLPELLMEERPSGPLRPTLEEQPYREDVAGKAAGSRVPAVAACSVGGGACGSWWCSSGSAFWVHCWRS